MNKAIKLLIDQSPFMGLVAFLLAIMVISVNGQQISSPCTSSMLASFTPCINFVTGSSNNRTSPTSSCCDALKSLMSTSKDCACLVITANVPVQLPFSRPLAMSLPRACNMGGVPLQCKSVGSPLPNPGPAILLPPPPPPPPATASAPLSPGGSPLSPLPSASSPSTPAGRAAGSRPKHAASPLSPQGSKAISSASPPQTAPVLAPAEAEAHAPSKAPVRTRTGRIRPIVPASASVLSCIPPPSTLVMFIAALTFKLY